jgi:hypothetical protein
MKKVEDTSEFHSSHVLSTSMTQQARLLAQDINEVAKEKVKNSDKPRGKVVNSMKSLKNSVLRKLQKETIKNIQDLQNTDNFHKDIDEDVVVDKVYIPYSFCNAFNVNKQ